MKHEWKENEGLPASLLGTLAVMAGVSVANLYYNQPLLNLIRYDLGVSEFQSNLIAMITQVGYALGLFWIVPLGDLYPRKRIVLVNFACLMLALLVMATAHHIYVVWFASWIIGVCSMVPQIFVPIASQFSRPEHKGRNVGMVISGLLTGILASRVVSGWVGDLWGWRTMYVVAAVLMGFCALAVLRVMPDIRPSFSGKYRQLMSSLVSLVCDYPALRIYALRSGLAFGSFLAMWSCLAFKMSGEPFYAGSDVVGYLGLCGIAGALTASFVGQAVKQVGVRRFNYLGCVLFLLAWVSLAVWGNTYVGIIAGVLLIDVGMQCIQLSNQTRIFELCPSASNRVNTIFMTTYFAGGSLGTLLAGYSWEIVGWIGVVWTGVGLIAGSFLLTQFGPKEQ